MGTKGSGAVELGEWVILSAVEVSQLVTADCKGRSKRGVHVGGVLTAKCGLRFSQPFWMVSGYIFVKKIN